MKRSDALIQILAMLASTCAANAALLVYEDYDYTLSDGTTMNGVATAATGFTGNYAVSGTNGSSVYATTGLTFGANYLPVSGGAVRVSASTGGSNSSVLGATLDLGGAQTGTLWSSYLVNFASKATGGNPTAQARVSDGGNKFNSLADNFGGANTGISYSNTTNTTGGTTLTVGTTYLMLSQFTNAGALGGGTATLWIFDLAGYDDWLINGGGLEANLGNYDLASQTTTSTTQANFAPGGIFQLAVSNATGSTGAQTVVYDELRWGTELNNVVAVPEPGTPLTLAGSLAALALLRRRPLATRTLPLDKMP